MSLCFLRFRYLVVRYREYSKKDSGNCEIFQRKLAWWSLNSNWGHFLISEFCCASCLYLIFDAKFAKRHWFSQISQNICDSGEIFQGFWSVGLLIWSSFFLILNNVLIFCYCDLCRRKNHRADRHMYVVICCCTMVTFDISLSLKFWFFFIVFCNLQCLFTVKSPKYF